MYDLAIVGGGAAGLCCAVSFAKSCPGKQIVLLEQLDRVGRKISVTGNGRCNITNRKITADRYYSGQPGTVKQILSFKNAADTVQFFNSIGIPFYFEGDKAYPASLQASSVTDALRFAAAASGVQIFLNTEVTGMIKKDRFLLTCLQNGQEICLKAKTVLMATGGLAGGTKLGSTGSGYTLFKQMGHRITPCHPALVQVKTENQLTRPLKGIKQLCMVTAAYKNWPLAQAFGEVLFCDYGLSGPPILQLSRHVTERPNSALLLDLFPKENDQALYQTLTARAKLLSYLPAEELFTGLLHKRIGQTLTKKSGIERTLSCNQIKSEQLQTLTALCKSVSFAVCGSTGYQSAQTTHGGAELSEFNPKTLMSRKVPGLFAAGEVLDCDGDCGGFNLEWAWRTGMLAADAAQHFLEKNP